MSNPARRRQVERIREAEQVIRFCLSCYETLCGGSAKALADLKYLVRLAKRGGKK